MRYAVLRNPKHPSRKGPSRQVMVDAIAAIFYTAIPHPDHPLLTLDDRRFDELEYLRDNHPERLRKFHALVSKLSAGETAYDALYHLRFSQYSFSSTQNETLYAYSDLLAQSPNEANYILAIHSVLIDIHKVQPDPDGTIATLEAHLRAKRHHIRHASYRGQSPDLLNSTEDRNYESKYAYVEAVQKHSGRIDLLLQYREERGILITNGEDNFDPADFEEYLKHSALADGWI